MAEQILMPQLGLTMEEGEISAWKVKEGDKVAKGDVIAEITTDKLTNDLESEFEGTVLKIVAQEGTDIPVKGLLAWIGEEGEEVPSAEEKTAKPAAASSGAASSGAGTPAPAPKKEDKAPAGKTKIVVLGAGPGGYVAAIRAAQLGAEVTVVEKENVGGTCLNVGCIPTKALLHSGELYRSILKDTKANGISVGDVSFDWKGVLKNKDKVVKRLVTGVKGLFKKNKITLVEGLGRPIDGKKVLVEKEDGSTEEITYDKLILATGSRPSIPPIPGVKDNKDCIDSTGALEIEEVPEKFVVVGGGVIGIELANTFANFGSKVTVLEAMPKILPMMDEDQSVQLMKHLQQDGIDIHVNAKVLEVKKDGGKNIVLVDFDGKEESFEADKILIAVGRRTETEDLKLDEAGYENDRGRITVNEYLETNIPDVYAVGDCLGQIMLAHVASTMGEIAAENAMGHRKAFSAKTNPSGVYTNPEIAGVGFTEGQLKDKGVDYNVGVFPFAANGKALIANGGKGEVKILTSKEYGEVLGVHIIGPQATDLIAEAALMLGLEATADDVNDVIHAHPTLAEAIHEAMLATEDRAIHF